MNLRPATLADLALLRRWEEQPHVIASDPNDDWRWEVEVDRTPDWREQLIAEVDGRPVGFLQIIDPSDAGRGYCLTAVAPGEGQAGAETGPSYISAAS